MSAADLFLALNGAVPGVKATRRRTLSVNPLTPEEKDVWANEQLTAILLAQGLTLKEAAEDNTLLPLVTNLKTAIQAAHGAMNRHYEVSGMSLRRHLASQSAIRAEMCILDATANPIKLVCDPGSSKESATYVRLHTLGISKKLLRYYEESVASEGTHDCVLERHPLMNVERLGLEEIRAAADELPVLMDELEDLRRTVAELRLKVVPLRDILRCTLQLRDVLEHRKATWRRRRHLLGLFC